MNGRVTGVGPALLFAALLGCGGATPPVTAPEDPEEVEPEPYAIALRLEDAGTDERDMPHTRVLLVRIAPDGEREAVELADETGACYLRPMPGALIAAVCWWAGAGAHYVVRRDGDAVVASRAEVDEETGEGELVEVGRVEVPRDAPLDLPGADAP